MINIKTRREIEKIKYASSIVAKTLQLVKSNAVIGVSLDYLNDIAKDFISRYGARASFEGLYGFPKSICLSVNNVIIHGIPNQYVLKDGDILGVDVGVEFGGWYGDAAITFGIGNVSHKDSILIKASEYILVEAIKNIKAGMYFRELSKMLQDLILSKGFLPLLGFCGHGIGNSPHESPDIPNFINGNIMNGPKIKNGMVFCIEPMICQKSGNPVILNDNWSVVSEDGLNGSHSEHTIAIIDDRAVILSKE